MFITVNVSNSAPFDSISFCKLFEINFWLVSSGPPVLTKYFSIAQMASEAQKPLAKMEFFLVCG